MAACEVNCYGANDVREGVAIMWKENVDVPSPETPPTRLVSSIQLQVPTKKSVSKLVKNTSPLLPAVVQDVLFTRTTWQQVLLPTV